MAREKPHFQHKYWIARRFGMMKGGQPRDSAVIELIVQLTGWPAPTKAEKAEYMAKFWSQLREQEATGKKMESGARAAPDFYKSQSWKSLRYVALKRSSGRCECCGARPSESVVLHVDHVLPRSKHPHLALELSNLQVLCGDCNLGKSNRDATDWREFPAPESLQ